MIVYFLFFVTLKPKEGAMRNESCETNHLKILNLINIIRNIKHSILPHNKYHISYEMQYHQ